MKAILLTCVSFFFFSSCTEDFDSPSNNVSADTLTPKIFLVGNSSDTAYLHSNYVDPGIRVLGARGMCMDGGEHKVLGYVDCNLPGVYTLTYTAVNTKGREAAPVTRNVHVVPHNATFLTGDYDVVCTCTNTLKGSATPTVVTEKDKAKVELDPKKNGIRLISLNIGRDKMVPDISFKDDTLYVWGFHVDYTFNNSSSGLISPSKNSFTIQTNFQSYSPVIMYKCSSVFTKKLTSASQSF